MDLRPLIEESLDEPTRALLHRAGEVADQLGLPCFAVGGLPRDLLLRRPSLDVDIMVEGSGPNFARALAPTIGATASVEERFLTAKLELPNGRIVDIASAREESYAHPGALPKVRPASAEAELARRDFSINALAVRLNADAFGRLFDPLGGAADIRAKRVRALHKRSFWDDPTRLWRAFRFAGRYGFRLEESTAQAVREAIANGALEEISAERLGAEVKAILSEPDPLPALRLGREYGALRHIADGLDLTPADEARLERARRVAAETVHCASRRGERHWPDAWELQVAALLLPLGPARAEAACRRLNLAATETRDIVAACRVAPAARAALMEEALTPSGIYELLAEAPPLAALLTLAIADDDRARRRARLYLDELRHVKLDITGDDLIAAGYAPGPAFSRALRAALAAKLDGRAPDAAAQLAVAKRMLSTQ